MRMSQLIGSRYKERPAEATLDSHAFLLRGAYARQVANGIYSLLTPGLLVIRKIEQIIREEMDTLGGQEVLMPIMVPRELWDESGRYDDIGEELIRFEDRTGHGMVLCMTHEEAVLHLMRNEVSSYAQFPAMVYHIQTKFRDEARSRGGLIRVREFTMKDAYSFHTSQEDLNEFYQKCLKAYKQIFARVGIPEVVVVESDIGMMGGQVSHEFMLLTDVGEDTVVTCNICDYAANLDVAHGRAGTFPQSPKPLEKVHTPGMKTIEEVSEFLEVEPRQTAKVVFYDSDSEGKLVVLLIRGDLDVNESKLAKIIHCEPVAADEDKIRNAGTEPGFASPMGIDRSKCRIIVDQTIFESNNLVCGANEVDYHYRNFNLERDLPGMSTVDVALVRDEDGCPSCSNGLLEIQHSIEVGNIFQLGTKYTKSMNMTYADSRDKQAVPVMGCYGIGIGRLMSSVMEARNDKYGPKWPLSIAPWQVHINALKLNKVYTKKVAENLYSELSDAGIEVIYDDRDATPGVQFADADLLGVPIRIIVSERNLKNDEFEWKRRDTGETGKVAIANAIETITRWVEDGI